MIKKGINIWSFPPGLDVFACLELAAQTGFAGIELALSAQGALSLNSSESEILAIRQAAERAGIAINSLATGLYWQYALTSDRADIREQANRIARRQIELARGLGADCVLICPGAVGVDFRPEEVVPDAGVVSFFAGSEVIDYEVAYERALCAFKDLAPYAEANQVVIGVENIWNKFLLSPLEMRRFIDEIGSDWVGVYFDVGNVLRFGYPEHWIRILGRRIKRLHFKDYRIAVGNLSGFVDLLAGDVDYVKVVDALESIGYDGWANAEMCPVYRHYSDQILTNTSASMDRILRRTRPEQRDRR
jgi:hexulose-6-phosphate isomerase